MLKWFKNLKKWQKGALIGLIIGIILGLLVSPLGQRISFDSRFSLYLLVPHFCFWYIADWFHSGNTYYPQSYNLYNFIVPIVIMIFYCGVGAAWGGILQINNRLKGSYFLALLIVFVLLFYAANVFASIFYMVNH